MDRPHYFIGVPAVDGKVSVELHRYLSALSVCAVTGEIPFTVNIAIVTGVAPVEYARNTLMAMALSTPASKIAMIDADMLPEPSATNLFVQDHFDIIVPRMYRFRHHGTGMGHDASKPELACCATVVQGEDRYDLVPKLNARGAMPIDACGTGFIVINRAVLEDERMKVGETDFDGVPAIFRMTRAASGRITEWEDVDFSLRASRLGYKVGVDFSARCGHRKTVNLDAIAELTQIEERAVPLDSALAGPPCDGAVLR